MCQRRIPHFTEFAGTDLDWTLPALQDSAAATLEVLFGRFVDMAGHRLIRQHIVTERDVDRGQLSRNGGASALLYAAVQNPEGDVSAHIIRASRFGPVAVVIPLSETQYEDGQHSIVDWEDVPRALLGDLTPTADEHAIRWRQAALDAFDLALSESLAQRRSR